MFVVFKRCVCIFYCSLYATSFTPILYLWNLSKKLCVVFDRKYTNRKCCCVINVMCMLDVGSRRVTSSPAVCRTPVSELVLLIRVTRQRAAPERRVVKPAVYCSVWMLDVGSRRATSSPAVCLTRVNWCCWSTTSLWLTSASTKSSSRTSSGPSRKSSAWKWPASTDC